jgi:diacylglycerol O-acyltransferase/trehalose O-mycolyltransferase
MCAVGFALSTSWMATAGPHGRYAVLLVPSQMGPVKVQVQWAAGGGHAALYLLDGMRARNDRNGWELDTDALRQFADDNINLVLPVGGQSSFYTDWYQASSSNNQQVTYKWETFLTKDLPDYLASYGISRTDDAVVGLSMGGSAALALAAYHHDQFPFAGSFSGFLELSAPGMPAVVGLAMLAAGGYSADSMWGPPWNRAWRRNDPSVFAPRLAGISLFIAAGNGIPGPQDRMDSPGRIADTFEGISLELLALLDGRMFQARMMALRIPATWDFTLSGTHEWGYWQSELARARPQILAATKAG